VCKKKTQEVTLTLLGIVRVDRAVRSLIDQRFIVNRAIVEYRGSDSELYRKAFESKGEPEVPRSGTHAQLNGQKKQW